MTLRGIGINRGDVSSNTANSDGEPGNRPNTEQGNPTLWKEDLGEICEICGFCAAEHSHRGGHCPFDDKAPMKDRAWRGTTFKPARKVEIVETGWVGAPPAIASARLRSDAFGAADVLRRELDGIQIHSLNIGEIRARYFLEEDSEWNALVRDETAAREGKNRVAKCPHCQHFGRVDHECSHETCQNCGKALDEVPAVDPLDDGKLSPEELRQMREAAGEPLGHVGGTFLAGLNSAEWRPDGGAPATDMRALSIGEIMEAADRLSDGERIPSEWIGLPCKADGVFRGVPLGEPAGALGEPGRGILTGTDIPPIWTPTADGTICEGCGSPIVGESCQCSVRGPVRGQMVGRLLESCDIIEAADVTENASGQMDTVPSVWVGNRVGQTAIYRPVRNGEISPQPKSHPPEWLGAALLEARCKDLANAGHRLAKCATCSGLLYEKDGNWFHDAEIPNPFHASAPVEIFDPLDPNAKITADECQAWVCEAPWMSNWDRLMRWMFPPAETLLLPEAPADWVDVLHFDAVTDFSFLDRLRILVSGRVHSKALIVCQNLVGNTKSVSISRPLAPGRGRE